MLKRSQDLRSLDLNVLMIFEAIYDARNVTQAARLMGMKQATVSNALSRLRTHFADPLFNRAAGGVAPTPVAEDLIGPIRHALGVLRAGLLTPTDFDHLHSDRQFCLALNDFAAQTLLPHLCRDLQSEAPLIRIKVLSNSLAAPLQTLLSGEADLIIDPLARDQPGVELEQLYVPGAVIIARADHPEIRGTISKEQFSAAAHVALVLGDVMRTHAEARFLSYGVSRRLVCEVSNCLQIPGIVAGSDMIATVPRPFAEQIAAGFGLQVLPPPFPNDSPRVQLGVRSETARDPGLIWLRGKIRQTARSVTSDAAWLD